MSKKTSLRLGYIPLTDCCVLAVAKEKGFFENYGLDVTLSREASWANIRDKVCVGALDGAHMLAGIPIATTLGLGFFKRHMVTAFNMSLNGNAITVSNELYARLIAVDAAIADQPATAARALKAVIEADSGKGKKPLTFAVVYPFSSHNYEIRYWLASAGIHPDQDVSLVSIPPQYMVENLKSGLIDGFCVGEPWNACAVKTQLGRTVITGYEIWNNSPEKVFGVTREWADKNPVTHVNLIKALLESAAWIDKPENRTTVAKIIADEKYIGVPAEFIEMSLTGTFRYNLETPPKAFPDFNVFHRYQGNFPWCSHAAWIISQMYRWGQLDECVDIKAAAESVYRPDIYRRAAAELGLISPSVNYKSEGLHGDVWTLVENDQRFEMGADRFLDEKIFNPEQMMIYLTGFSIATIKVNLPELAVLNH